MMWNVFYYFNFVPDFCRGSVGIYGAGIFFPCFCFTFFGDVSVVCPGFFEFIWLSVDLDLNLLRHFLYNLIDSLHSWFHQGTKFLLVLKFILPIAFKAASKIMFKKFLVIRFIEVWLMWRTDFIGFSVIDRHMRSLYRDQFGFWMFHLRRWSSNSIDTSQ